MTRSILVADNSKTIQTVINYTFRATEFEVFVTSTGQEALAWLADNSADIVVADVNMPQMDGYKLCNEIRSNNKTKNIPVLLLTRSSEEIDDRRAAMVEANASIHKPFESQALIDQVKQLCGLNAESDLPATFGQQLAAQQERDSLAADDDGAAAERDTIEPTPQELENAVEVPMPDDRDRLAITEPAPENPGAAALGKMKLKRVATPVPASTPVIRAIDSSSRVMSDETSELEQGSADDSFEIDAPIDFEDALEQSPEQTIETPPGEMEELLSASPSESSEDNQEDQNADFNAFTDGLDVPSTGDLPAADDGLAELDMSEFDSLMPPQDTEDELDADNISDDFDLAVEEPEADADASLSEEESRDDNFEVALEDPETEEESAAAESTDEEASDDGDFDFAVEEPAEEEPESEELDVEPLSEADESNQEPESAFEPAFGAPMSDIMAAAAAEDAHEAELLAASSSPEDSAGVDSTQDEQLAAASDDIAVDFDDEEAEEMLNQGGPTLEPPPSPDELQASAAVDVDVWSLAEPMDDDFSEPPHPSPAQDNWTSTPPLQSAPETNLPTEIAAHGELPVAEALVDSQLEPAAIEPPRTPLSRDPSAVLNATAVVADAVAMVTERGAESIATHGENVITQALDRDELIAIARDVMEKVAWEVIPELAETIIRGELEKLLEEQAQKAESSASPGPSLPPPPPVEM